MAQVGEEAPQWSAPAYVNGDEQTVSSEDLDGDWYVLYWYPLDFTFVCPTEIREFQNLLGDFKDDGVKLIGASTDSFFSHKNWFENSDTFDQEITHPVLADTNHEVSKAFGMLKEDEGVAFRGTAIVDPEGTIRSLSVNDLDVGRSPQEVLRTTQALISGGMCGADWESGDDFVA